MQHPNKQKPFTIISQHPPPPPQLPTETLTEDPSADEGLTFRKEAQVAVVSHHVEGSVKGVHALLPLTDVGGAADVAT